MKGNSGLRNLSCGRFRMMEVQAVRRRDFSQIDALAKKVLIDPNKIRRIKTLQPYFGEEWFSIRVAERIVCLVNLFISDDGLEVGDFYIDKMFFFARSLKEDLLSLQGSWFSLNKKIGSG